jgi:hypothetical protein
MRMMVEACRFLSVIFSFAFHRLWQPLKNDSATKVFLHEHSSITYSFFMIFFWKGRGRSFAAISIRPRKKKRQVPTQFFHWKLSQKKHITEGSAILDPNNSGAITMTHATTCSVVDNYATKLRYRMLR